MKFFYTREETESTVTITYTSAAALFYLVLLSLVLSVVDPVRGLWYLLLTLAAAFLFIAAFYKPNAEVRKAMRGGYVKATGNKFSLKDPPVIVIEKDGRNA